MNPLALLALLRDNWKALAIIAVMVGIFYAGDQHGDDRVTAAWTQDKLDRANELQAAKDKAAADAKKASAAHQAELAAMQETLTKYERLVAYEIKRSYSQCVFTPELVELWQKSFGHDTSVPGQP
jgi:hypothetical protein